MAADGRLEATIELVDSEEGHWCSRCALPSGCKLYVAYCFGDRLLMRIAIKCRDCDGVVDC